MLTASEPSTLSCPPFLRCRATADSVASGSPNLRWLSQALIACRGSCSSEASSKVLEALLSRLIAKVRKKRSRTHGAPRKSRLVTRVRKSSVADRKAPRRRPQIKRRAYCSGCRDACFCRWNNSRLTAYRSHPPCAPHSDHRSSRRAPRTRAAARKTYSTAALTSWRGACSNSYWPPHLDRIRRLKGRGGLVRPGLKREPGRRRRLGEGGRCLLCAGWARSRWRP